MAKKKAVRRRVKTAEADVVRARSFVLVDDSDRTRAHLSTIGNATVLQFCDLRGRPQMSLQMEGDGQSAIILFDDANVPGVSIAINNQSRGISITSANQAIISMGMRAPAQNDPCGPSPNIMITDSIESRGWSALPFTGPPPESL